MGIVKNVFAAVVISIAAVSGAGSSFAGEQGGSVKTASLTVPTQPVQVDRSGDLLVQAESSMVRLGNDAVSVLSDKTLKRDERISYFRKLISGTLDIKVLGKFMLGREWKRMDDAQKAAYLAVFKDFIVQTYATRLGGTQVSKFQVTKTRLSGNKDVLVYSRVSRPGNSPINAVWRLRERGDRFVILDLVVEGISMALTLRQEFTAILRKAGGVDGLIRTLKERSV
ncbi:MAG: ABC transporter substrate-binding protein [Rhodospirillales bacterium]|nr:ABC transporter substrate-binding protein [Rhodospirillales bacterium]